MLSSAPSIAPKPAALPPAAQNAQPAAPAGVPSFAQFLNDPSLAPPNPAADAAAPEAAAEPPPANPPAATPRRPAQAARPTSSTPGRSADAAATSDAKIAAATARAKDDSATAAGDDDDTADTSELKEFTELIGLAPPNAAPLPAVMPARPETATVPTDAAMGDDEGKGRSAPRLSAADAGRMEARDAMAAKADDARSEPRDAAPGKSAALRPDKGTPRADSQPTASVAPQHTTPEAPGTTPAGPSFAAALAHAQATTPGAVADVPRPTASAQLQAPLHSAAFAPELGTRVSLMAVNGVQQAELQLNPAEMGPVNIQITVEAGQAQVSFHAVQAETRQALEQSLPDLAAALQGQGLTLSGGGVFQQPPRDTNHESAAADAGNAERGTRRGVAGVAASSGASAAPVRRTVGLLDTFA